MDSAKNIKFKKSLGQNFIFDKNLLAAIVGDAQITSEDTVLEVGSGAGTLTAELAKKAGRVISVEVDRDLKPVLEESLSGLKNVELIFGDILKMDAEKIKSLTGDAFNSGTFKVVANLPYYITTPVIFHFLESVLDISSLTLMVQKEVAERIAARPGSKIFGALSLSVQSRADVSITRKVGRNVFVPAPEVDSAIIRLDIKRPFDPFLARVIKGIFAMRRKTVLNNICSAFSLSRENALSILSAANIKPESRAEQLGLEEVKLIATKLKETAKF